MSELGCVVKLPTYRPQLIPLSDHERNWIRMIVTQAVFSTWNKHGRPTDLKEIYQFYREHVDECGIARSKRTVDRRVNEAASLEHGAKIVCVTAGIYQPSPKLFEEAV